VEDDRRLADLTAEYFEQNGLSVAIESRGDSALARFAQVKPRVVLLDLMLPGVDGLTICRELRETFDGPILIFTARDSDIDQVIGLEAGAEAPMITSRNPSTRWSCSRARAPCSGASRAHPNPRHRGVTSCSARCVSARHRRR
jgi:CheY-like chemotaxis protein